MAPITAPARACGRWVMCVMVVFAVLAWALPVHAGPPATRSGAGMGTMAFGKRLECDNHGASSDPSGAGVPFSPLSAPKRAWARVQMDLFSPDVPGRLVFCVRLQPIASNANGGIGATCDLSKGHGGRGKIDWGDGSPAVWLADVGWKASVLTTSGTYYAVTGSASSDHDGTHPKGKGKPSAGGTFVALLEAQASSCFFDGPSKTSKDDDSQGHHLSPGLIVFTVTSVPPSGLVNQLPLTCKREYVTCLYGPKD